MENPINLVAELTILKLLVIKLDMKGKSLNKCIYKPNKQINWSNTKFGRKKPMGATISRTLGI